MSVTISQLFKKKTALEWDILFGKAAIKKYELEKIDINKKILFQDNMSAMKIEKNGSFSAGPKSRHLKIRYFFIKDIYFTGFFNCKYSCGNDIGALEFLIILILRLDFSLLLVLKLSILILLLFQLKQ